MEREGDYISDLMEMWIRKSRDYVYEIWASRVLGWSEILLQKLK